MCMLTTDRQTVNNYSSHVPPPHPRANLLQFEYIINGIKVAETVDILKLSAIAPRKSCKKDCTIQKHTYIITCPFVMHYNDTTQSQKVNLTLSDEKVNV